MRVDKIVLRAILNTLAAIAVLFVLLFSAVAIIFPSTMMQFTYDLGMDGASIHFAERAYERGEKIYFIGFATEVAIGIEDYEEIDVCGEKFIKDNEFAKYCESREKKVGQPEGAYAKYIYGQICVAKYYRGKKIAAVERAFALNGERTFETGNPVAAVLFTAIGEEDKTSVALVVQKMETFDVNGLSAADQSYFNSLLGFAREKAV